MTTIFAFALVLGVAILVHEFGHFIIAKWIGVRVEKFSLGFGPKLIGFKKGETEYVLSAFPLGGFVKMSGENTDDELHGEPWEFSSRTVLERARIVACGPLMNILLAVFLMTAVFMMGHEEPIYLSQSPVVGWVVKGSMALRAGVQIDDTIISINGDKVETWGQVLQKFAAYDNDQPLEIVVMRSGQRVVCSAENLASEESESQGFGAIYPLPAKVGGLSPGYPAEKVGLRIGDVITAINGEKIQHWFHFSNIIHKAYEQELEITVLRGTELINMKITPVKDEREGGMGLIGVELAQETVLKKYGFAEAVVQSFVKVSEILSSTLEFVKNLVLGRISSKYLGGPIAIAQISGEAAKKGSSQLFFVMVFLNLQLGVLNLLPIPILDGGVLVFLMLESIIGQPVSIKKREIAQQVGLSLLLLLMVFAFYNDIMRLL